MNKQSFLAFGLAILTLGSCSKDEPEKQKDPNEPVPITFTSTVAQTRSANVNLQKVQIAEGVKVGVFVQNEDGFIANGNNTVMTADGKGGFSGASLYFPTDGSAVSIYAYAPYSVAFSDMIDEDVAFSVAADQSTDAGYLASDLLRGLPTGENSFTKQKPTVALNFSHKLTKISIKFKTGSKSATLDGASVSIVNTKPTTTLRVSDGAIGEATGNPISIKAVSFSNDETNYLCSAVIVPQRVESGSFVQVNLKDGKMLNAQLNTTTTFESGKAYTYTINISGEGDETIATIEQTTTVSDWDKETEDLEGELTKEEGTQTGGEDNGNNGEDTPADELLATFGNPGGNASYSEPTYTWTATTNNLMSCFEFKNGELANYKTLEFTISNLTGGMVRMGYYVGSAFTEFGSGYGSNGTKTINLTTLGIDLSKVTKISFGGRTGTGSVDIKASDVKLKK
ncbi:MAG: fimbrillin family protein, partial [Prevotella sp.]|nr:fimbrillin family protein [Prevotella sp.]MBR1556338.1 fimbrillin family protein [Prevotella sp.]